MRAAHGECLGDQFPAFIIDKTKKKGRKKEKRNWFENSLIMAVGSASTTVAQKTAT